MAQTSKVLRRIIAGIVIGAALWLSAPAAASASNWQVNAFEGQKVELVVVNQQRSNEVAAVANGELYFTRDSGLVWQRATLPLVARAVLYDPTQFGVIYVGTDQGLYLSIDDGFSWKPFSSSLGRRIILSSFADSSYLFISAWFGAGTPVELWRLNRSGTGTAISYPSGNASCLDYDYAHHRLYLGAAGGVYSSVDEGASWSGSSGAGTFSLRLAVRSDAVWQLSADGLFRSINGGSNWNKLAGPGDLNNTYYGNDMRLSGLAINHGRAFYGAWSFAFPYKFLAEYSGASAHSVYTGRVYDVAASNDRIWVASESGLRISQESFESEAVVRRPVLILPGIMGSFPTARSASGFAAGEALGYWEKTYKTPMALDPIGHTYDGLVAGLIRHGYENNRTLFVFPYNWTQDNSETAIQLSQKLYEIRQVCGCSKVDLVAHSMGGLVARAYIQGPRYQGDVANLIQLGTPNAGAIGAYSTWESGNAEVGVGAENRTLNLLIGVLMSSQVGAIRASVVRESLPAVGQLLPISSYIEGRVYPEGYPRNRFLEDLNEPHAKANLAQLVGLYEVGGSGQSTPARLTVGAPQAGATLWPHGRVLGQVSGEGDGTVLRSSLADLGPVNQWLRVDHNQLVSAALPFVMQTLLGGLIDDQPSQPPFGSGPILIAASGPVELTIMDSRGHQLSKGQNNIAGAYYSGAMDPWRLATLAPDGAEKFWVVVSAKTSGTYSIAVSQNSDNGITMPATGLLSAGQSQTFSYDVATKTLKPTITALAISSMVGPSPATPSNASPSQAPNPTRLLAAAISLAQLIEKTAHHAARAEGVYHHAQSFRHRQQLPHSNLSWLRFWLILLAVIIAVVIAIFTAYRLRRN